MGDLSKNLNRSEFKCRCGASTCDYDTVDVKLVEVVQAVRDHFGASVKITSGNRCPDYNRKIGGALRSYHPRGRAADIKVRGVLPSAVYRWLISEYPNSFGLGKYDNFTHVDTRTHCARWG